MADEVKLAFNTPHQVAFELARQIAYHESETDKNRAYWSSTTSVGASSSTAAPPPRDSAKRRKK